MNYFTEYLSFWCKRAAERVKHRKAAKRVNYAEIPEGARVRNALSGKALFHGCRIRRRGYIVYVPTEEFCRLGDNYLDDAKRRELMDDYLRGKLWNPMLIRGNFEHGKCKVIGIEDFDTALFMREIGKRTLTLQLLEEEDVPATKEKLELLEAGLYSLRNAYCSVLYARIAY